MKYFSFRFCIALIVLLLGDACLFAQNSEEAVKKKVAVYVSGDIDASYKKVIGSKMVSQITKSKTYTAVERTADFLAELQREMDYQTSGEVRDNQIASIGKKFGVKFVAIADATESFDEVYLDARLINVETAEVVKQADGHSVLENMSHLISLAEKVATDLTIGNSTSDQLSYNSVANGGDVESFTVNGITFEMIKVPGGTFMMGSYDGESDESPVHSESVSDFYIGKTEVTQALWQAVMGSNPSNFRGEMLPVENVSWYDCQEFVERLSQLTGRIFRLPSEVEWEFAAKGGISTHGYTYSGGNDLYRLGWYDENSGSRTHPVGSKLPNELGIYDMSGNVWEWTSDLYSSNYSSSRNGGSSGSCRVDRGGGWVNSARNCRAADRYCDAPSYRDIYLGLRLAL